MSKDKKRNDLNAGLRAMARGNVVTARPGMTAADLNAALRQAAAGDARPVDDATDEKPKPQSRRYAQGSGDGGAGGSAPTPPADMNAALRAIRDAGGFDGGDVA